MTLREMPKNFDFSEAEPRLYQYWESNRWFKPECAPSDAEPFVIAIPPPNVTGELHIGHALFVSLEDLMIRYERMRGKAALWIPGTDHAGIATQLQVEKLLRSEGSSRVDIGREAFEVRTWEWKRKYGGRIIDQMRSLGASADWERERFTLDEKLSIAVKKAFVTLWEQGLIYRGPRLINWSPGLQTAVSDVEVEREEENAFLYYFKYPIEGGEYIPVATTRPETILGDSAVAVHPEDERYKHLIGKKALVPILNRAIPVIADEYVDRAFGTGALKITPAHDFNDYEIGQRHGLELISIMNRNASLNENAGPYVGMDRFEVRKKLWADMEAAGLTIKVDPHTLIIPRSQRGGEVVEPMLSVQWFVKMDALADKAVKAVRNGDIKIVPERFEKVYYHWLESIKDWCISRQLWWGHRIPAWHHKHTGEILVGLETPPQVIAQPDQWEQDPDVLDTWFSSGLWPFSTLGWPEKTPDLERFYPTAILETGYDILFFWVARMIMMGLWFTDKPPFHTVYLHGLVRDEQGRKMSKTLNNVIDPLSMTKQYGTDALRFTLLTGGTPGNDQNLSESRIEYNRNFGNKLWQITKFITSNLGDTPLQPIQPDRLTLPDRWILSRATQLAATVQRLFDSYQYGEAGTHIQEFAWNELADWYVEISKNALYGTDEALKQNTRAVLIRVLETVLTLLHPYMPYITEEIWSYLPNREKPLILTAWVKAESTQMDSVAESAMATIKDLIVKIRNVRTEYNVEPGKRITALAASETELLTTNATIFARLCNVERIDRLTGAAPDQVATVVSGEATLYLPLGGLVDFAAERERLNKELANLTTQITATESKLNNEGFVSRARPDVVARERAKLTELTEARAALQTRLEKLP
jgi:valyl-tRNA synthetase